MIGFPAAPLLIARSAQLGGHDAYEVMSLAVAGLVGVSLTVRLVLRQTRQRSLRRAGTDATLLTVLALALFVFLLRQVADENCHGSCTLGSAAWRPVLPVSLAAAR